MCICFLKGHLCTREGYLTFSSTIYSRMKNYFTIFYFCRSMGPFMESSQQARSIIYVHTLLRNLCYCVFIHGRAYLDIVELVPLYVVVVIVTVALDCGAVVIRYVPQLMSLVPGVQRKCCFFVARTYFLFQLFQIFYCFNCGVQFFCGY